jgi:hypothetical protein
MNELKREGQGFIGIVIANLHRKKSRLFTGSVVISVHDLNGLDEFGYEYGSDMKYISVMNQISDK